MRARGCPTWKGGIAEFIVFDRSLSASDVACVEGYLADKYGITLK